TILGMRLSWLWLGLIWGLGMVTGGLHPLAAIALALAWTAYAAFLACLGLWFSVVCRTGLRATIATLLATLGLSVGHWLLWLCCIPGGGPRGIEEIAKFQAGLTPPAALAFLAFHGEEFRDHRNRELLQMVAYSLFGILVWAGAAAAVWSAVSTRFR